MINNKYYWMRLYTDFFEQPAIRHIMTMKQANSLIVILLKLSLMSVRYDGVIRVSDAIFFTPDVLSKTLQIKKAKLTEAISLFKKLDLVSADDNQSIIMNLVIDATGKETSSAKRKRDQRNRDFKKLDELLNKVDQLQPTFTNRDFKANRENQEKREYKPFVWLKESQFNSLYRDYDEDFIDEKISELSTYIEMKGVYYEDHYKTLLHWIEKETI